MAEGGVDSLLATQRAYDEELLEVLVEEIGGESAYRVVKILLSSDKEITDEEIANKLDMQLNAVRKVLYRLYEERLASYRRTRDTNTGWFIYYWKIRADKVREAVIRRKQEVYLRLSERLKFEKENMLFHCGNHNCQRLTFDEAMETEFKCPNCGEELKYQDNSESVKVLEKKLRELREELKELEKRCEEFPLEKSVLRS
ncbi:MAG: transcription factor E [Candidatus Freyarchaeota archaeon]|nr:transcription factor E [Candidatus Jordarchaeia archaeon]